MHLVRRLRVPAITCALALLLCELAAHPYTTMGICDDGPYILAAQKLAATGHIAYNGWSEAMLGWQLYLGAAFTKLFGLSFTAVRMSNLVMAMAAAFALQRTMVRAQISERNATLATLAVVLSPLYLVLSVTFMTDISCLFGIVLCLYGCLRALRAASSSHKIGWLYFAVTMNAICGTSRQLAWLGILAMVPSTLWLLRSERRVLFSGIAAVFLGVLFIYGAVHWFSLQPYTEHSGVGGGFSVLHILWQVIKAALDAPFLLLPLVAIFIPGIRRARPWIVAVLVVGYLLLTFQPHHAEHLFLLEPMLGDWLGVHGTFEVLDLKGAPPIFLNTAAQVLLTVVSIGGLLGLIASLLNARNAPRTSASPLSWRQLGTVLAPFTILYIVLLVFRAATAQIVDRYLLGLLPIAALCLARYYQDRVRPQLPRVTFALIAVMAIGGVAMTHNLFSLYRARVAIATELRANGVPETSVDNGWEYNLTVELQHTSYINFFTITKPANAYVNRAEPPAGMCDMRSYYYTPHVVPEYGISFDPDSCYGPAPFIPVHYSRWFALSPGTLYVVHYMPAGTPR